MHHPVNQARADAARMALPAYLRQKYPGRNSAAAFMATQEAARELLAHLLHLLHQVGDDVPAVLELSAAQWAEEVSTNPADPTASPMLIAHATLVIHQ